MIDDRNSLSSSIIGAAIEVHRHLGPGYLESVYEEALAIEFTRQSIRFERQHGINVNYKGIPVGETRLDFLVDSRIVVELKAVDQLHPVHTAQVKSSLISKRQVFNSDCSSTSMSKS